MYAIGPDTSHISLSTGISKTSTVVSTYKTALFLSAQGIGKIVKNCILVLAGKFCLVFGTKYVTKITHISFKYIIIISNEHFSESIPYIVNCLRWKSFAVTELNCNSLENIYGWTVVLHGQGITQAISLEKFHVTNRSAKTTKRFHLERFAMYSIPL